MSFTPKAVFLIGPNIDSYSNLGLSDNKSYLCLPYTGNDIKTYATTYDDCSGGAEWPDGFLGNKKGLGRLYVAPASLNAEHIPLLAEKRIVAVKETSLDVWAMNGDVPAGCEPIISRAFTPLYSTMWGDYPTACGKETDDYVFIRDDFYPAPIHKSYIDFYRVHDGVESARVSAIRSNVFTSMTVPPYRTQWVQTKGWYGFTARSQHVLSSGETAYFEWQMSKDVAFANESWAPTYSYTLPATLVQHWVTGPPYTGWVYDYHESLFEKAIDDYLPLWYFRVRRVDKIGDAISDTSDWIIQPWTVTPTSRSDMVMRNDTPSQKPYYLYRDYTPEQSYHQWGITVYGQQGGADQEPDIARIQVSTDNSFATVDQEFTDTLVYGEDGWENHGETHGVLLPVAPASYVRCRYETTDGETVGPWSNVFQMDADARVNRSNWYGFMGEEAGYLAESHWTGEKNVYTISSEAAYVDGHTYVLLCKKREVYETTITTADHKYWSLWLADYDGAGVVLTQIVSEIEDNFYAYFTGWPIHNDIVEFNEKLYAGWSNPPDPANLYDWCEITGGVIGEIHHVAIPAEATEGSMWATMAVIHGDLRVVASLGEAPVEVM